MGNNNFYGYIIDSGDNPLSMYTVHNVHNET